MEKSKQQRLNYLALYGAKSVRHYTRVVDHTYEGGYLVENTGSTPLCGTKKLTTGSSMSYSHDWKEVTCSKCLKLKGTEGPAIYKMYGEVVAEKPKVTAVWGAKEFAEDGHGITFGYIPVETA